MPETKKEVVTVVRRIILKEGGSLTQGMDFKLNTTSDAVAINLIGVNDNSIITIPWSNVVRVDSELVQVETPVEELKEVEVPVGKAS